MLCVGETAVQHQQGQPLSAPDAQQVHQQLRQLLPHWTSAADCQQIRILYGGSVNSNNAAEYLRYPDNDGVLVGSGSLKADSFNNLCRAIAAMNTSSCEALP